MLVVIGQHSDLDGRLGGDAMLLVGQLERLETVGATDHALVPMGVGVLGLRNSASGTRPNVWKRHIRGTGIQLAPRTLTRESERTRGCRLQREER